MKDLEEMQAALAQDYRLRGDAVFRKRYEQLEAELQRLNQDVVTRDDSQGDQMMSKMFQGAAQVLVQLPGSRRHEVEADLVRNSQSLCQTVCTAHHVLLGHIHECIRNPCLHIFCHQEAL